MVTGPAYAPHPASHHQHTLPPASGPSQNPYVYAASPPPPAAPPLLWQDTPTPAPAPGPSGGFSFPVPIIPAGGPAYSSPPSVPLGYNGYGGYPTLSRIGDERPREELNPHLQTRYQSPLPLPPGAEARPVPAPGATLAPPETPPPAWSPATPPKDDVLDRRREAELAA
ncbi:hypothetical protein NLJ89_g7391 [Agrocybe chaxingu]|uniref:Uncharacterized protein n=1 Tax=Agrocybe chaxingu TaxID=84603 RepID=A0A9W8K3Q6_9AGAR|nr:hypothetical protein NLJ89_g7391 [Agrocybe chaxingu]